MPPSYLLMALALMVALHFVLPLAALIAFPWRLIGVAPIGVGVALNLLADRAFKRHQTTVKPFERSSALVTDGVFGLSRNPMYLGMVLIAAGVACVLGSLSPWFVVPALGVLLDRLFIAPEERILRETFGPTFDGYQRRVRRWL